MFLASKSHRRTRQLRDNRKLPAPFALIIINLVKSLSKWKILSNLAFFFHSVYKTNIDCFLFGAQFKFIGPRWCQNHDYALSFASGIVMVLTSPRAYNFNCAPQSSQHLYTKTPYNLLLEPTMHRLQTGVKIMVRKWNLKTFVTKMYGPFVVIVWP